MFHTASPYSNTTPDQWLDITQQLVANHPLSTDEICDAVLTAWNAAWSTQIGIGATQIAIHHIAPPATVIGYFFEKLLAHELARRYPNVWR